MCKYLNQPVLSGSNRYEHYLLWISLEAVKNTIFIVDYVFVHVLPMPLMNFIQASAINHDITKVMGQ
jgi:hypothetical protein